MAKRKIRLSVAIATFNEEGNIGRCLSSIREFADEIIVVDGGSNDRTVSIVRKSGAKVIRTDNPPIFHINKQKALDACRGDWILQLDADEVVPMDLRDEILAVVVSKKQVAVNGFYIPRRNYFWGHFMKKGGQYPDYVIRLIRKGKAYFPAKSVHEQISVKGQVGYLMHPMLHYSYATRGDYWRKAETYTRLTAMDLKRRNIYSNPAEFFNYIFFKPIQTFFLIYLRHKGFVDGLTGFEFSLYSALHFPAAYLKGLLGKEVQ